MRSVVSEYAGRHRDAASPVPAEDGGGRRHAGLLAVAVAAVVTAVGLITYLTLTAVELGPSAERTATPSVQAEVQLLGRPGGALDLGDLRQEVGQAPQTTADPTPRGDSPSPESRIRPTAAPSGAESAASSPAGTASTAISTGPGGSRTSRSAPSGSATSSTASSTAEANARTVARAMLPQFGWSGREFGCLSAMWTRLGLWGSTTQVRPGLGYIAGRYGSPCAAWAQVRETGQY